MNYNETCEYLTSLERLGSVPGLSAITELLDRLGNPQNHVRFVHISGTNGKGSVGSFICSILIEAGYRVGRYLSPAVWNPLEIIELNGQNITAGEFSEIIDKIKNVCDSMHRETGIQPTRFEIETAAAFVFFDIKKCDIAVIECGMGGLLDATNVITNTECAVITKIALDHMSFLGDSVLKIAAHKAGIIKPKASVICLDDPVTSPVIRQYGACHGMKEFITVSENDIHINSSSLRDGLIFDYKAYKNIKIHLSGTYQAMNAALAAEVCMALRGHYNISEENIRNGLMHTTWNGRFQVLGSNPYFIIDGAHNENGAMALANCIDNYFPGKKATFIIGVFADKEYGRMLNHLMCYADMVITIETPDNKRALSSKKLAEYIKKYYDIAVYESENIDDAVKTALKHTGDCGIIIACGSLSHLRMVSDAYDGLKGRQNNG